METQRINQEPREAVLTANLKKVGYSDHEIKEAVAAWAVTKSMIPKTFDAVSESESCYFCVSDPEKTVAYAHIMLAHEEPITYKKTILSFGKKNLRSQIGSLLPMSIPVCKRCKRVFKMVALIKWVTTAAITAAGYGIWVLLDKLGLIGSNVTLAFYLVIVLAAGLGYFVGKVVSASYAKRQSAHVHLDLFEIDILADMKKRGWFLLQDNSTSSAMVFKKSPENFGRVF